MFESNITLIRDIASVIADNSATVIIENGEVYVSHSLRGHDIITHFKGDGVMNIYRCSRSDIPNLESFNGILYDTHWTSSPCMGYRAKLKELCGE